MINLNKSPLGCSEVTIIIRGCGTSETAAMATLQLMEMRLAMKWEGIGPLNVPFCISFSLSTHFPCPCGSNSPRYSVRVAHLTLSNLHVGWHFFLCNCVLFSDRITHHWSRRGRRTAAQSHPNPPSHIGPLISSD